MAEPTRSVVHLRVTSGTLDPDEVTRLLKVEPTACARKGETRRSRSGREVVARSGSWHLDAGVAGSLDTQIVALLAKLPDDATTWRELSRHGRCDVFCGVFMREGNAGTELTPEVLSSLGQRYLHLGLDLYDCS